MRRVYVHRTECHAVVPMGVLLDPQLSFKAKGLLALLLNLPEGQPLARVLKNASQEGRTAVEAGMQELERAGYVVQADKEIQVFDRPAGNQHVSAPAATTPARNPQVSRSKPARNQHNSEAQDRKRTKPTSPKEEKCVFPAGPPTPEAILRESTPSSHSVNTDVVGTGGELFPKEPQEKKTILRNSAVGTYEKMLPHFIEEEAAGIDIRYYFGSVFDWSESSGKRRTARGWVATMRQFMRSDNNKGKLKRASGPGQPDLSKFLEH